MLYVVQDNYLNKSIYTLLVSNGKPGSGWVSRFFQKRGFYTNQHVTSRHDNDDSRISYFRVHVSLPFSAVLASYILYVFFFVVVVSLAGVLDCTVLVLYFCVLLLDLGFEETWMDGVLCRGAV